MSRLFLPNKKTWPDMSKYVCKSDKNAFLEYIILYFN